MKTLRLLCLSAAAALCGPAFAITLGGGGDARALDLSQKFDLTADPAAAAATYVATQADGKLKGIRRIAIANVCVQFVNGKSASGGASGASITYIRSSEGNIPGGLDPARMQAIADSYLETLESDLKAAGYEIVPYEELAANPQFQKLAARYQQGLMLEQRAVEGGRGGLASESFVSVSPKQRPFARECASINPATTGTFVGIAYKLDAEILTASAVIDLGQAKAGGGFLGRAKADIEFAQFVRAGESQYQFVGKTGPGARIWLKQSIVPAQNPFQPGEKSATERSGSYDAASGRTTTSESSSQAIGFDEDLYYRNAQQHLGAMHRLFMTRMPAR